MKFGPLYSKLEDDGKFSGEKEKVYTCAIDNIKRTSALLGVGERRSDKCHKDGAAPVPASRF